MVKFPRWLYEALPYVYAAASMAARKPTRPVLAAVVVKLALAPLLVYALALSTFGELRPAQVAAVLEVAMPTMLMAASFADRFQLDVRAAALTVSWSSLGFLLTLPVWIVLLR